MHCCCYDTRMVLLLVRAETIEIVASISYFTSISKECPQMIHYHIPTLLPTVISPPPPPPLLTYWLGSDHLQFQKRSGSGRAAPEKENQLSAAVASESTHQSHSRYHLQAPLPVTGHLLCCVAAESHREDPTKDKYNILPVT